MGSVVKRLRKTANSEIGRAARRNEIFKYPVFHSRVRMLDTIAKDGMTYKAREDGVMVAVANEGGITHE
jgi:hypothetical protein